MNKMSKYYHLYQPIFSVKKNDVVAYEAFIRSVFNSNPLSLFKQAREENNLLKLDIYSIRSVLKSLPDTNKPLYINIFPSTLISDEFLQILTDSDGYDIVFELNESNEESYIWKKDIMKERLDLLRDRKVKWALDDVGSGQASIQKIIDFKPDYIKLDKYFSEGLSHHHVKQKVVTHYSELADYIKSSVILEGVEKLEDFNVATQLGVNHIQGYLLGKPSHLHELQKGENKYEWQGS